MEPEINKDTTFAIRWWVPRRFRWGASPRRTPKMATWQQNIGKRPHRSFPAPKKGWWSNDNNFNVAFYHRWR